MDALELARCDDDPTLRSNAIMSNLFSMITEEPVPAPKFGLAAKTVFDTVAASIVLVLISPLLLVIAILVSLDGGTLVTGHRRLGKNGREFVCFSFRTLQPEGRPLAASSTPAAGWAMTRHADLRTTTVGRFLRATGLDEVPQLLNVVRGEMSLVGPAPITHADIVRYGDDIDYYCRVRPGLTGPWQLSGRSRTAYRERIACDVDYVKTWSWGRDISILFRTVEVIVRRRGSV